MATERLIKTKFWTDNYISTLDPIEKLLFLYFISNPLTNISGVYEITLKQIGFDTGLDKDMVNRILGRFEDDKKMYYREGWLGIKNFIKNQHVNSKDVQTGIQREISLAPESIIITTFGRGSIEGGGRVGGGSHILNLTKLNLTEPKNDDSIKKNKYVEIDWDHPFTKAKKKFGKYFLYRGMDKCTYVKLANGSFIKKNEL